MDKRGKGLQKSKIRREIYMNKNIKRTGVQNALASLGDLKGKTRDQIIEVCGEPRKTEQLANGTKDTWWDFVYKVTISFDNKGNFTAIVDQSLGNTPSFRDAAIVFILCCILVGGIIAGPALFSTPTVSHSVEDSYGHDKFDALTVAEKAVSSQLKSPSTASFCKTSEATITVSGDKWRVSGWVDAQNSFGASIRNNYVVEFEFSSKSEYKISKCEIK